MNVSWKSLVVIVALSAAAVPQARVAVQRVRISGGVTYAMADRKVLPDVSVLKGRELNTEVVLQVLVSKTGEVVNARASEGDAALLKGSEQAALKWHYRPYILNGVPIEFVTTIHFGFKKDKVQIVVPPPGHP